ncbi:hypothetical protein KAFR_0C06000 [Kazachstania africana CBS 2517]|uniref:Flavoprotein pyridine nucleotide cytochrome reductase-like FAD-binding domain-containing protein n=1 Tax=Kazachstania africana (strain ATCC 22294 / BCRC 22015 / CBS 2517 / CECT 1963 / NBRC 1671 / NRRL Y-8276) TaxID=1071382 RepID=H2AT91_KAZAF|nr:hypothetical protein KAFR_0C06000 [Kazachstania africana CBS 2517]CCF57591.1 hypothetical protein KAFR_0C06000 [Kazachstania africana CBS 2517]
MLFNRWLYRSTIVRKQLTSPRLKAWRLPVGSALAVLAVAYGTYNLTGLRHATDELSPLYFIRYKITQHKDIDSCHFLLELSPLKGQKVNLWSTLKNEFIWSIEIKQPEIMITRRYTPLPMRLKGNNVELLSQGDNNDGRLLLYVKEYNTGELTRWLSSLPTGHIVEVRGPFVDYQLIESGRYDQINFFTAGTGVTIALQFLLNKQNDLSCPKVKWFHSCNTIADLGPLTKLMDTHMAENCNIRLQILQSSLNEDLRSPSMEAFQAIPMFHPLSQNNGILSKRAFSFVCGPEEYIATVAGNIFYPYQGPIGGILKLKGWPSDNVRKLS